MQLISLLLLAFLLASALAAPAHVPSPSGHKVPLSLLRRHLPRHPPHLLRHALYEHDPHANVLRSSRHTIALDAVAPRRGLIREHAGFSLRRGDTLITDLPSKRHGEEAFIRRGPDHIYAYARGDDGRDLLVAGFSPGVSLRPLHITRHPGIYVNYDLAARHDAPSVPLPRAMRSVNSGVESAVSRQANAACQSGSADIWYEIAFSFDRSFCALYGDVERFAVAAIQAAVLAASGPYQQQSCIRLALTHIDASCGTTAADPFSAPNNPTAENIQGNYRDVYQTAAFSSVSRDVAMLVTGYDNVPSGNSDPAGIAGQGTLCRDDANFAWVQTLVPSLIAHEFGHTLGAEHDDSVRNIMSTTAQLNDPFTFSTLSLAAVTTAITGPLATCASTAAPVCDNTCPNGSSCTNGLCVTPPPTPPSGNGVLCSRIAAYRCVVELAGTAGNFARGCPSQFNFVQRTAVDSNDFEIVCCSAPTASQQNTRVVLATENLPGLRTASGVIPGFVQDSTPTESVTLITATLDTTCGGAATTAPPVTTAITTAATTVTTAATTITTATTTTVETTTTPVTVTPTSTTEATTTTTTTTTMTTTRATVPAVVLPPPGGSTASVPVLPGVPISNLPGPGTADIPVLPGFPKTPTDNGGIPVLPGVDTVPVLPAAR